MAMYVMEEMPDIHGTGEQVLYPRFAMMDQVSTEELIRQIASSSGFNVGDVEGVITQIGIEMAHQMAEGKSVKLDGIGTFSPSLALCKDKEREKARFIYRDKRTIPSFSMLTGNKCQRRLLLYIIGHIRCTA